MKTKMKSIGGVFLAALAIMLFAGPLVSYLNADSPNPTNSMELHFSFDWYSGTTVYDESYSGGSGVNDGILVNGASITTGGICHKGVQLNGPFQYVNVPRHSSLEPETVSVSAWVKPDGNVHGGEVIVTKRYNIGNVEHSYALTVSIDGRPQFQVSCGGVQYNLIANGFNWFVGGSYTHIVGVFERYNQTQMYLKIFVNGMHNRTLLYNCSNSAIDYNPSMPLCIGGDGTSNTIRYFQGQIDEVAVYSKSLSNLEGELLYFQSKADLYHTWDDSASSTYFIDDSGHRHNMQVVNATVQSTAKYDEALYFGGNSANDYGYVSKAGSSSFLAPTDAVTVTAWVRIPDGHTLDAHDNIISLRYPHYYSGAPYYSYGLKLSGTRKAIFVIGVSDGYYSFEESVPSTTILNTDTWYHITGTWFYAPPPAVPKLKIYIDGALDSEKNSAGLNLVYYGGQTIQVGRYTYDWCELDGYVDDVAVYSFLLTDDEIADLAEIYN
jgi:hypothetical protein